MDNNEKSKDSLSKMVGFVAGPKYNINRDHSRVVYMSEVSSTNSSTSSRDK